MQKNTGFIVFVIAICLFFVGFAFAQMEAPPITGIACYNWQTGAPEPCDDGGPQQGSNQGNQGQQPNNGYSDGQTDWEEQQRQEDWEEQLRQAEEARQRELERQNQEDWERKQEEKLKELERQRQREWEAKEKAKEFDRTVLANLHVSEAAQQGISYDLANYAKFLRDPQKEKMDDLTKSKLKNAKSLLNQTLALDDKIKILEQQPEGPNSGELYNNLQEMKKVSYEAHVKLKSEYGRIILDNPDNAEANMGMARILREESDIESARVLERRAFLNADPLKVQVMKADLEEEFLNNLRLSTKPDPENSVYLKKMREEFSYDYSGLPDEDRKKVWLPEVVRRAIDFIKDPKGTINREIDKAIDSKIDKLTK